MPQARLAERVGIGTSTMCRTLQRLERSGPVARRPSETDRRNTIVETTEQAEPVRDGLADVYERNERILLAGLDTDQISQLAALLDKVIENLTGHQKTEALLPQTPPASRW